MRGKNQGSHNEIKAKPNLTVNDSVANVWDLLTSEAPPKAGVAFRLCALQHTACLPGSGWLQSSAAAAVLGGHPMGLASPKLLRSSATAELHVHQ